ncbi:ACT domain-containing protein [Thermomonas carbonis]|uniref:ACT domain-containing protein n=1 Tax=Thermomonas carbonis TaxID=1463158 RepID=A0A7G9SMS9_9GAMM|nr:ACT domain-containing protein [Thermomonas carbonis]QNN69154.1 ACT domain-containing protein [Thermomonas carbonis]GHC06427.1 hypothetical protein GCM10010080_20650 [Thermomonas carbonis]
MAVGLELVSDRNTGAIRDLDRLLAGMRPSLQEGRYAFTTLPPDQTMDPTKVIASIREAEGLSMVLAETDALALGLPIAFVAAWITLEVHSDLAAIGLTAAFSQALAQAGIGCNVVAGAMHDHLFVPVEQAPEAMAALQALQEHAAR